MLWWEIALRIALASAAGCVIGAERECHHRPAGLRTHMLVCVGASLVAIIECLNMELVSSVGNSASVNLGRMSAQVISGIGFLGAGTIFMDRRKIAGLTTAASLWCTACLGLVAGMGYYLLLTAGCLAVMLPLALVPRLVNHDHIFRVKLILQDRAQAMIRLQACLEQRNVQLKDISYRDTDGQCTAMCTLHLPRKTVLPQVVAMLAAEQSILAVQPLDE